MEQALQTLGFETFAGMGHNYFRDNRFPLWDEAIKARHYGQGKRFTKDDFEKFLGPYEAVGGWMAALLAEDLVAAYPDAKVILTTRDPDQWVESWDSSVVHNVKWWQKWWWILPLCGGKERDFRRNAELSHHAWNQRDPYDRDEQRRVYVNHNRRVREIVPKERLLHMEASGDWKPLCDFLGKEVPKGRPYPHAANHASFRKAMNMIWMRALMKALVRLTAGLGFIAVVMMLIMRYWRRRGNANAYLAALFHFVRRLKQPW